MTRTLCLAAAWALCLASTVTAQSVSGAPEGADRSPAHSFAELQVRGIVGAKVSVVDASGHGTSGRVETLSSLALVLAIDSARRQFAEADVRRIERRRRDPVRNGVALGAGAGALLGFSLGRSMDSPDCSRPTSECGQGALIGTVGGALWGAVGGWITDALIRRREVIYAAPDRR